MAIKSGPGSIMAEAPSCSEAEYEIAALARLAGVNARTIRTWENRYEALKPKRGANGRRLYDAGDLRRLVLLKRLADLGHAPSRLARLDDDALEALALEVLALEVLARDGDRGGEDPAWDAAAIQSRLRRAAADGDIERFGRLIRFVLAEFAPLVAVEHYLAPVLGEIGALWAERRIGVGVEHALSEVVLRALHIQIDALRPASRGAPIGFATLGGERHEFGALMACYLAAARGCRTLYVGPDMPAADLAAVLLKNEVQLAVVGYVLPNLASALALKDLGRRLAGKVEIWLGGPAAGLDAFGPLPDDVAALHRFADFTARLEAVDKSSAGAATRG